MSAKLDLTGRQFGKLTAIKLTKKQDKYNHYLWKCKCECDKIKYARASELTGLKIKSCGCRGRLDLKGQIFGRLTVLQQSKQKKYNCPAWVCRCQCGNKTLVRRSDLTRLKIQSCGCFRREVSTQRQTIHGDAGKHPSKLYNVWISMKKRCSNKNNKDYANYGGRGIKVCEQWLDFVPFKEWAKESDYREGLQIDRINNDGDYCPTNCRWVTPKENARNRRKTLWGTINGETKPLSEWCEIYKIAYRLVYARLSRGWDLLDALTKPLKINQYK